MKKYNVIVIGLGLIGMRYGLDPKRKQPASHIAAILENKNLQLIGVCDTEKNARDLFTEKYKKIHVFDNFSDERCIFRNISKYFTCGSSL